MSYDEKGRCNCGDSTGHATNQKTARHTPGPWTVDIELSATFSNDGRTEVLLEITNRVEGMSPAYATNAADAAFIVRACNSHADLLAALRQVADALCVLNVSQGANAAVDIARAAIERATNGEV